MPAGTKGSTVLFFANKALALNPSWRENSQFTCLDLANDFNYVINNYGGNSVNRSVPFFKPFIQRFVFPGSYPVGEQTVEGLANYHDDNDFWKLEVAVPAGGTNDVRLVGPNGEYFGIHFYPMSRNAQITMSCGNVGKTIVAGCNIFSQLDGTTWKRSNERLVIVNKAWNTVNPFTFSDWLQAYSKTIVTTKYLNQGNASTGISGQNG